MYIGGSWSRSLFLYLDLSISKGGKMKVIDITGPIYEGMWDYGGEIKPFKLGKVKMEYAGVEYELDSLENMIAFTGTYFETPGDVHGYTVNDVPLEKLIGIDSYVLQMPYEDLKIVDNRPCVFVDDMKKAEKGKIPPGSGIIMSTGYGKNWEKKDYLERCPYLNKAAMDYLIDKEPFIVVFDTPSAENDVHPENAFERYFNADILTVTACINLEKIAKYNVKLTVLPLKILKVALGCPARAIVIED
jgi:kynurenine formamidase